MGVWVLDFLRFFIRHQRLWWRRVVPEVVTLGVWAFFPGVGVWAFYGIGTKSHSKELGDDDNLVTLIYLLKPYINIKP